MGLSNIKGDIAELAVAKRFLELGYWVSLPFGDNTPYDLLIDKDGDIKRVQVKYTTPYKDYISLKFRTANGNHYKDCVDFIVAYNPNNSTCYKVSPQDFDIIRSLSLKLNKPKNNQIKGIHLAENYIL